MASNERKEIIQINGLTILIVMALCANFLIVSMVYRYHNYELVIKEKEQNKNYKALLDSERVIKNEIITLEGVPSWNDTAYVKSLR